MWVDLGHIKSLLVFNCCISITLLPKTSLLQALPLPPSESILMQSGNTLRLLTTIIKWSLELNTHYCAQNPVSVEWLRIHAPGKLQPLSHPTFCCPIFIIGFLSLQTSSTPRAATRVLSETTTGLTRDLPLTRIWPGTSHPFPRH